MTTLKEKLMNINFGRVGIGFVAVAAVTMLAHQLTPLITQSTLVLAPLGALLSAMTVAYWLLIALWLYQAAERAKMSGWFWSLAGLLFNILAVAIFLPLRQFGRGRCSTCHNWSRRADFCPDCGAAFYHVCPGCGAKVKAGNKFCTACGKSLDAQG